MGYAPPFEQVGKTPMRMFAIATALVLTATSASAVTITADVVYGHKAGMALVYDVFQPEQANGAGVLFMVSGGWFSRWQPPERRQGTFQHLLDAGFTMFAVHHGSAPRFKVRTPSRTSGVPFGMSEPMRATSASILGALASMGAALAATCR